MEKTKKDDIALIKEMLASLEKTLLLAETEVSNICYFEDSNVVRVYLRSGSSVCVNAEGINVNDILYKTLQKTERYLCLREEIEKRTLRTLFGAIFLNRFKSWED
jgi:hypothetical protein